MTWIEDLKSKHKKIFEGIHQYNFEVGDGWKDLVEKLSKDLSKLSIQVVQVKQKFGGLRFYIDAKSEKTYAKAIVLIDEAEKASFSICESCGKPGTLRSKRGWLSTLCPECGKEWKECNPDLSDKTDSKEKTDEGVD